jgi:hypothetical protein
MATATTPTVVHKIAAVHKEPAAASHKETAAAPAKKNRYTEAVGRRKTAIARVRISAGTGKMVVNGKTPAEYFTLPRLVAAARRSGLNVKNSIFGYTKIALIESGLFCICARAEYEKFYVK